MRATSRLALDFHHELYPQADALSDGEMYTSRPDADLTDRANALWPIAAVLPVVPLTALPPGVADWVATALVLAALVGALWVLDVRDWRIYGVVLLWPSVIDAIQTANASLPLTLLVAVMWRYRDRAAIAGVALGYGIAIKFFLWPVAVWLALVGRRTAAAVAAVAAAASLAPAPAVHGIGDYLRRPAEPRRTFEHDVLHAVRAAHRSRRSGHCRARGHGRARPGRARRSPGGAAAWGSRSRPRSSSRRSCGVISSRCCIVPLALVASPIRRRLAVPLGMWVGDGHVQRRAVADRLRARARQH